MMTDIEIARSVDLKPITEIAESVGIKYDEIEQYGKYKAKINDSCMDRLKDRKNGKLVLVTAINPTPAGEGKTTITVGLGMALNKIGKKTVIALREPSLGPVFGIKGGAAGGGYSQVLPMEDINLHFTGDLHAVTAANNLLCALVDNHIHNGNKLGIDTRRITFSRVTDTCDRSLRNITIGLGGKNDGMPREDHFMITAASEVMAILCLCSSINDLKERLGNIMVGHNFEGKPVFARDINAQGAMAALLKDAIKPNLVQTIEHTPALIHGGPFANIAHGCNSIRATELALKLGDYAITEAGFGADLGAEKFFDIKCRIAGLKPDAVVLVATVRALKYNGGVKKDELCAENTEALIKGAENLIKHIENIRKYGLPIVVAINRFGTDTENELNTIKKICNENGADVALCDVFMKGSEGGIELAEKVAEACDKQSDFSLLYSNETSIADKIETIAKEIYGAKGVKFDKIALSKIDHIEKLGGEYSKLPICMAKTQYSLSDDMNKLGRPTDFNIHVKDIRLASGAGFIVVLTGSIMTMPGLPKVPSSDNIDIDDSGIIKGLF